MLLRLFVIFIVSTLLFSCQKKEHVPYVTIQGRVINPKSDSIYVVLVRKEKRFALDPDGNFSDTIQMSNEGYFTLTDGLERFSFYLIPGDSLYITLDAFDFFNTLKFSGKGSDKNNYLVSKLLASEERYGNGRLFYDQSAYMYKSQVQDIRNNFIDSLLKSRAEDTFKETEKANIDFEYLDNLLAYPEAYHYYNKTNPDIPEDFFAYLDTLNVNNEVAYNKIPAFRSVALKKVLIDLTGIPVVQWQKNISDLKNPALKSEVFRELGIQIKPENPNSRQILELIEKSSNDNELIQRTKQRWNGIRHLQNGQPSPKFNFRDSKDNLVNLEQFKGNLVYIYVWSTNCVECVEIFPEIRKLQSEFLGNKIRFIGISLDSQKDLEKWKNFVKENELKHIHLITDKDWSSAFIKDYKIEGIPRYILIDKSGNIINAHAPEASSQEIRDKITSSLEIKQAVPNK